MKRLTQKQKEDMQELSKKNNSLRFFRVDGVWYEMTGGSINGRIDIKPNYKGQKYITLKDYIKIVELFINENNHLINRIKELKSIR